MLSLKTEFTLFKQHTSSHLVYKIPKIRAKFETKKEYPKHLEVCSKKLDDRIIEKVWVETFTMQNSVKQGEDQLPRYSPLVPNCVL